jgi:Concanavalin A-like lectin/glucanases superfamily
MSHKKYLYIVMTLVTILLPMHIYGSTIRPGVGLGLLVWYRFSDGLDSIATDSSGRQKDGTLTSMDTVNDWVPGPRGRALSFNGTSGYVDGGSISTTVNTVSFWIKTTNLTQDILDLNGTAYVRLSGGTVTATGWTSPTVYVNGTSSSAVITSGAWNHVTITTGTTINASAVNLGKRSTNFFSGSLDEVRMYSRAITAAEALTLYRGSHTRIDTSKTSKPNAPFTDRYIDSSLIGYWTLNGPNMVSTTTALNLGASSTLMDGLYVGTNTTSFVPGKNGQAMHFPERSGAFNTQYGNTINPTLQPLTVSFWVKKMDTCTDAQDHVFGWGASGVNTRMYIRCTNNTTNKWGFRVQGVAEIFWQQTIVLGEWYHIALLINGTSARMYVNGSTTAAATMTSYTLGGNLYFGGFNDNTTTRVDGGNAVVDEVRIYKRALSVAEIQKLYYMDR